MLSHPGAGTRRSKLPMRDQVTGRYLKTRPDRAAKCDWCGVRFERLAYPKREYRRSFCTFEHYNLARAQTVEGKFWASVDKRPSGCWLWLGERAAGGYGAITVTNGKERTRVLADRFSWQLHNGEIPAGLKICHACDVPQCVNPEHLWLGTQQDNIRDMEAKGRRRTSGFTKLWVIVLLLRRIRELEAIAGAMSQQSER